MFTAQTQIRIHYALTDQMGFVYYGRFAEFFEIGRVESFREAGIVYKDMEAQGIIMPITEFHINYFKPAKYDDLITVVTTIHELPLGSKIIFHAEVFNEQKELLCKGYVHMYFIDKKSMARTTLPTPFLEKLKPLFQNENVNTNASSPKP